MTHLVDKKSKIPFELTVLYTGLPKNVNAVLRFEDPIFVLFEIHFLGGVPA